MFLRLPALISMGAKDQRNINVEKYLSETLLQCGMCTTLVVEYICVASCANVSIHPFGLFTGTESRITQLDHNKYYRLFTEHRGLLTIHIPRAEPEGVYS